MPSPSIAQKGFTLVEVCLIVAALVLAGFEGFRVYANMHPTGSAPTSTQSPGSFTPEQHPKIVTVNGHTIVYVTQADNDKTISVHIGMEIRFQLDPSLTWYYASNTTTGSGEDPLAENSSGDYTAQSAGVDDITVKGTNQPYRCPPNADCAPLAGTGFSTVELHVKVIR